MKQEGLEAKSRVFVTRGVTRCSKTVRIDTARVSSIWSAGSRVEGFWFSV